MQRSTRKLIFRLSSLGDIVMATSALAAISPDCEVDWVVAREFASLLEGHPRIRKLWIFDRAEGFVGWVKLCRRLWSQEYAQVFDLHSTLRTRVARVCFFLWNLGSSRSPKWRCLSKQRVRLWAYYLLKKRLPRQLRPTPFVERFARLVGGNGKERPDLSFLVQGSVSVVFPAPYLCVMPGAHWPGKRWAVNSFADAVAKLGKFAVVLGTDKDSESAALLAELKRRGLPCHSAIGRSLKEVAAVLAQGEAYLGNDTGLAHLAEAVGKPAFMIFGPTTPEMGFGPWRQQSLAMGSSLPCRPCGKDGRACYRISDRYRCLRELSGADAARMIQAKLEKGTA